MSKDKNSSYVPETVQHSVSNVKVEHEPNTEVISSSSRLNWSGRKFLRSFNGSSSGFTFVKLIFLLFFTFVMFEFLVYNKFFTFSGLLEKLSSYSSDGFSYIANWLSNQMHIEANWGVFDFLRKFINMLSGVLSLLINIVGGFMDILHFLFFMIN